MKSRYTWRWLMVVVMVGGLVALAACGGEQATATPEPAAPTEAAPEPTEAAAEPTEAAAEPTEAAPEPTEAEEAQMGDVVRGGSLRVALGSEPQSIDPFTRVAFVSRHPIRNIFSALVAENVETGAIEPELAESWEISEDGLVYTFHLREDVQWHDGRPFVAEDVKYTIEHILDPDFEAHAELKAFVEGSTVETPDEHTVVINREAPSAVFLLELTDVFIVPHEDFNPEEPVGTGPFKFEEWVRNERLVVSRNENYWKPGLPYLDEVVFVPIPEEETRMAQLATGQIQMIDVMPIARVEEAAGGAFKVLRPVFGVAYYPLLINEARFPMDDYRVRQALNYAIDREAIQAVLFGQADIRSNPVPPQHWAFNPDALSYNERDLDKAASLLTEAGWSDSNEDGIWDKDGEDLTFELDALNIRYEFMAMAEVMQANWTELGANVSVNTMELGAFIEKVCNENDSYLAATGSIPWSDPSDLLDRMITGCHGIGGWENERYREVMDLGKQEVDQEKRIPYYHEAQEIFMRELPSIVVAERPIIHGAANEVQGFHVHSRQIMNFETVWLENQ